MRHLFVAAAFIVVALVITFGTASVLQSVATAKRDNGTAPGPVLAEPASKLRSGEQARQVILAARRAS